MANIVFTENSGVADSIFGKCQAPIASFIKKKGEAFEQSSLIKSMFSDRKSNHFGELYGSMTAMEGFKPVGENGAHPVDGMREGYKKLITNVTWKSSFSISREAMDDSQIIDLKKKPEQFTTSYYRTRERFGAALYGAAINLQKSLKFYDTEFPTTTADGETLFSKNHPSILGKKKQSNFFSDAFSKDALGAAESRMHDFRDDQGAVLNVAPDTIVIANDYKLINTVFEVIGSDKDPDTSNNGFNFHYGRWNIICNPYLNEFVTGSSWMLLDSHYSASCDGAIFQDRTALEVKSYIDNSTDANVWNGFARFSGGFVDWRFACLGGVSGGDALIS